jgi:hypothetical protein
MAIGEIPTDWSVAENHLPDLAKRDQIVTERPPNHPRKIQIMINQVEEARKRLDEAVLLAQTGETATDGRSMEKSKEKHALYGKHPFNEEAVELLQKEDFYFIEDYFYEFKAMKRTKDEFLSMTLEDEDEIKEKLRDYVQDLENYLTLVIVAIDFYNNPDEAFKKELEENLGKTFVQNLYDLGNFTYSIYKNIEFQIEQAIDVLEDSKNDKEKLKILKDLLKNFN